jgi:hypothetical protein
MIKAEWFIRQAVKTFPVDNYILSSLAVLSTGEA